MLMDEASETYELNMVLKMDLNDKLNEQIGILLKLAAEGKSLATTLAVINDVLKLLNQLRDHWAKLALYFSTINNSLMTMVRQTEGFKKLALPQKHSFRTLEQKKELVFMKTSLILRANDIIGVSASIGHITAIYLRVSVILYFKLLKVKNCPKSDISNFPLFLSLCYSIVIEFVSTRLTEC
jgi:hypothetical protein